MPKIYVIALLLLFYNYCVGRMIKGNALLFLRHRYWLAFFWWSRYLAGAYIAWAIIYYVFWG